jgi:LacI family transcriptional regulator
VKRPQVLLIFRTRFEESTAMLKGIAHFVRTHDLWNTYHDEQAVSVENLNWVRDGQWQGVICRHTTPELAAACTKLNIPLVDLNDVDPFPKVPKIRPDNIAIGHLGAEHFIDRGYRKFGFAGFSNKGWSCERRDGFVEALRLAGHECTVFDVEFPLGTTPLWVKHQIARLADWLRTLPKPIGLMACIDLRARHLVDAAHAANILVPEGVAILGTNNDTIRCELTFPALSSVAPNAFQSGYRAACLLSDMLAGRKVKEFDQRVEPLGVVTRRSTDILAVDDQNVASALRFIRDQACNGITVNQIAKHAHFSRSLIEKRFRIYIGRSPQAEIRRIQLGKIRQLLIDTNLPLKRIAELAGFNHTEYMCVLFKKTTGYSPGVYREKMQDKETVLMMPPTEDLGALEKQRPRASGQSSPSHISSAGRHPMTV